ncbi:MAG: arylamine N-acetyltransferase, partial [Pseudomonas sp.]|nr:arylamine N-acetyltransferase [Pseudomonas sp.]
MSEAFKLDLHTYLGRLGYCSAPPPTLDTLRELQARHTAEFPFETLANMIGIPVEVEPAAIRNKLLRQGRGAEPFDHQPPLL